ncbi:MAG: pyridoxal kinase [Hyphomicrobium sp.]|nr:pyridoxal kinase [Hyphomicrobium sp.]
MGTILAISSQVARGHVGLSAVVPALQALGHEVIALPTIMLSNHPGHGAVAGQRMEPALLSRMLATLDAHGWLAGVDAVLSGYLPTQEHVAVVAEAVGLVRAHRAKAPFFCDPGLGDDPNGLYIAEDAARSLAERLVPLADVIFPNRFELQWLASQPVTDAASAAMAGRALGTSVTVATSIPAGDDGLATMAVTAEEAWTRTVVRMNGVPNGTGDLLAALFTGHMVNACAAPIALKRSVIGVQEAICASAGRDELNLIAILKGFRR